MISGFALLLTIPLVVIFFSNTTNFNENVVFSQIGKVSSELAENARSIHYLGEPSQKTISIYFPNNIESVNFDSKTITIAYQRQGTYINFTKYVGFDLYGNLTTYAGFHNVKIRAVNTSVEIVDANK